MESPLLLCCEIIKEWKEEVSEIDYRVDNQRKSVLMFCQETIRLPSFRAAAENEARAYTPNINRLSGNCRGGAGAQRAPFTHYLCTPSINWPQ